jgi:hypothetical protein
VRSSGFSAPALKAARASSGVIAVDGSAITLSTQSTQENEEWM